MGMDVDLAANGRPQGFHDSATRCQPKLKLGTIQNDAALADFAPANHFALFLHRRRTA
jgi:hypothetical protein